MGQVIAHYRKKRGWTQESLAIALACSKKTVEDLEGFKSMNGPDIERRKILIKLLRIPPALLALDWRIQSLANSSNDATNQEKMSSLLEEDMFTLYEHILVLGWGCLYNGRGDLLHTSRVDNCIPKLESVTGSVPETDKEPWQELLCQFYLISTRFAQHSMSKRRAIVDAQKAVDLAASLDKVELLVSALYRRATVYLEQSATVSNPRQQQVHIDHAKDDIVAALKYIDRVRGILKGNVYLMAAEINTWYAGNDVTLQKQCMKWQDKAASLIYRGELEDEGNFLKLNASALHHEKSKMQLQLGQLKEARSELNLAWKTLPPDFLTWRMNTYLTEATLYMTEHDLEGSVHAAMEAYHIAHAMHSNKGKASVKKIYTELKQLDDDNPHICKLGVMLDMY
jgi:transcriptional regulator with XRE-family HTH domain